MGGTRASLDLARRIPETRLLIRMGLGGIPPQLLRYHVHTES